MRRNVFLMITLLVAVSASLHAQVVETGAGVLPEYETLFATFAGLAGAVIFLMEGVKKMISGMNGLVIQIVSWLLGIATAMVGWWFNVGFLEGTVWYVAFIYGLGASLVANGLADTGLVQWIIGLIFQKKGNN